MLKKFLRILVYLAVIFAAVLLTILLIITKLYPPEKIKTIVSENLSQATQRRVNIESASFNVFKGLTLSSVTIFEKEDFNLTSNDSSEFLSLSGLQFRYFLPALLKMELQINKIVFENPRLFLKQKNGEWNFSDLIAGDTTEVASHSSDSSNAELPFALDVKEIAFENLQVFAEVIDRDKITEIKTGGVTVKLAETFLPKFSSETFGREIRAHFFVSSDDEEWQIKFLDEKAKSETDYTGNIAAQLDIFLQSLEHISARANLALRNVQYSHREISSNHLTERKFPFPEIFSINLLGQGNSKTGDFSLQNFELDISNQKIWKIGGEIKDLPEQPNLNLSVMESDADLGEILNSFLTIMPDSLKDLTAGISISGKLSLAGTHFSGNPFSGNQDSSLKIIPKLELRNFSFRQQTSDSTLGFKNFDLSLKGRVTIADTLLQQTFADIQISGNEIFSKSDTIEYSLKNISGEAHSHLDASFNPDTLIGNIQIGEIFGSPLSMNFDMKSQKAKNEFLAHLKLIGDSFSVAELTQNAAKGRARISLNLSATRFDSVFADLELAADSLEIISNQEDLKLNSITAGTNLILATDSTFEKFELLPSTLVLGDFGSGYLKGNLDFGGEPSLNLYLDSLILSHEKILNFLPESIKEELYGLSVWGKTFLASRMFINLANENDSLVNIRGSLKVNGGIDYPQQYISIGKLSSELQFSSNGESAGLNGFVKTDSLVLVGLQDSALQNVVLKLNASMPDFETLILDSATLNVPEWKSSATLTGSLDSLSGTMSGKIRANLSVDTNGEEIALLNGDMKLNGNILLNSNLILKGNDLQVSGLLNIPKVDLVYAELVQIDSLRCRIIFEENLDMVSGAIQRTNAIHTKPARRMHYFYDVFRPYYLGNDAKNSFIKIDEIKALDYQLNNFKADLVVKNERIQIPEFHANIYGGNISGQFMADLGDGSSENIKWRVKANLARLNSALLITGRTFEENAELDMNLELDGKGIDPEENLELSGFLYVTKMGAKFTDNVLQAMDPQQTDKSIQDTRRLLKWGYKPKLVSIEIKHGNLYPTIHLVKGSIFARLIPLNLSGGKIELARIPLDLLFSSLGSSSQ